MYLVFSTLPHFTKETKTGPITPREIGYSSTKIGAESMAKDYNGFVVNINEMPLNLRNTLRRAITKAG